MTAAGLAPRRLGGFTVSPLGLGCMNLSHAYGAPPSAEAAESLLRAALDAGVTHFDTAALYGFGANESLVGRVLAPHRGRIVLASKGGLTGQPVGPGGVLQRVIDGRPASLKRDCEASLKRLGTDVIDLYYLHRWDRGVPVEESAGAIGDLVRAGKVRHLGLSEVSAATLARAHREHPVAAVQTEYSLWTRNPEIAVLDACREIGAAFVAFSPLARGFLTAAPPDVGALDAKDIRRSMPRFAEPHWGANLALRRRLRVLADEAGCTLAQLALAWVLGQGEHVVAIPGTTRVTYLRENLGAAGVALAPDLRARVDALMTPDAIAGPRYGAQASGEVDTETF